MPVYRAKIRVYHNQLDRLDENVKKLLSAMVAKAAHDVVYEAQAKVVELDLIDTGFMLSSIEALQISEFHWQVTVGAFYGIYHEFGTRYMPARPFMGPAADKVMPDFWAAVSQVFQKALYDV